MRIGTMGRMQGMGDILTDEMQLFAKLGVEICHDDLGCVYSQMQALTDEEVKAVTAADREEFQIDPKLTDLKNIWKQAHTTASRLILTCSDRMEDSGSFRCMRHRS